MYKQKINRYLKLNHHFIQGRTWGFLDKGRISKVFQKFFDFFFMSNELIFQALSNHLYVYKNKYDFGIQSYMFFGSFTIAF